MSSINYVAFSDTEEYAARFTPDGVVYIYNTVTGKLQSEYTPSSHLSATPSCLTWCPLQKRISPSPKKKKLKTEILVSLDDLIDLKLLAIGTETGAVLLYSVTKGNLHATLDGEHSSKISGICWAPEESRLYSCSTDKHVVEWDLCTMKSKSKWKAADVGIHALCLLDDDKILTASTAITLWDLKKKSEIQKFVGHATEIWKLISIDTLDKGRNSSGYFLSSAVNDRTISAWHFRHKPCETSIASYVLKSEPVYLDVKPPKSKEEPIIVFAVARTGQLLVFEHHLNGRKHVPLKPRLTVSIKTHEDSKKMVPIIATMHCKDSYEVVLMYGNVLKPQFEKVSLNTEEKELLLVRECDSVKTKSSVRVDKVDMKIADPKIPSDATSLGPAQMIPLPPRLKQIKLDEPNETQEESRSRQSSELSLSIDERLKAEKPHLQQPTAGNFAHLLVQALQNRDEQMLTTVLDRKDITSIESTIRKLPDEYIGSFLVEVQRRLFYKGDGAIVHLKWLDALLNIKFSVILKLPDVENRLLPIVELLRTRSDIFDRVYKLRGRLNTLLLTQADKTTVTLGGEEKALLIQYNESSSENEESEASEGSEDENSDQEMNDVPTESSSESESDQEEIQPPEPKIKRKQTKRKSNTNHNSELYSEDSDDSEYAECNQE